MVIRVKERAGSASLEEGKRAIPYHTAQGRAVPLKAKPFTASRQDPKSGPLRLKASHSKADAKVHFRCFSAPHPTTISLAPVPLCHLGQPNPRLRSPPQPSHPPHGRQHVLLMTRGLQEDGFSFYAMFLSCVHSLRSLMHVIQRQLQTLIRSYKQVSPFTHRVCKHPYIHMATIPFHFISWEKQNKTGIERLLRAPWSSVHKANNTHRLEEFLKLTERQQGGGEC